MKVKVQVLFCFFHLRFKNRKLKCINDNFLKDLQLSGEKCDAGGATCKLCEAGYDSVSSYIPC